MTTRDIKKHEQLGYVYNSLQVNIGLDPFSRDHYVFFGPYGRILGTLSQLHIENIVHDALLQESGEAAQIQEPLKVIMDCLRDTG